MTQNKQYTEQHKMFGRVRAVPRLCGFYPGICLTTEEKAWKNLSQGSQRVPVGTMKILKHINQKHEKDSASYYKRSEEWVMILACCNMSHNNKLEFVFIEKSPPQIYICCACRRIVPTALTVWCSN